MNIWTVLKTLLFTTIMPLQSILSTVTDSRPVTSAVGPPKFKQSLEHLPTHSSLALSTLRTLSHLSFVINKFGGVTSTSSDGFAELKRVFYSALDLLSADVEASEIFVKALSPARNASIPSDSERFRSKDVNSYLLDIYLFDPIRNLSNENK